MLSYVIPRKLLKMLEVSSLFTFSCSFLSANIGSYITITKGVAWMDWIGLDNNFSPIISEVLVQAQPNPTFKLIKSKPEPNPITILRAQVKLRLRPNLV